MTELERVLQQWLHDTRLPRNERVWALGQALAVVRDTEQLLARLYEVLEAIDAEVAYRDKRELLTQAAFIQHALDAKPPS